MQEVQEKDSRLRTRGIFTISQWCKMNGYGGVTKECLLSASQQDDAKLRAMAENHLKTGIVKNIKEKK
jgi:hypothetical protein